MRLRSQGVFKHVEEYFAKTNTDDAVKMAQAGRSSVKKTRRSGKSK